MQSSVLLRHTRDRLNSLRQLVEPPQIEVLPLTPEDYEDLVNLVLEFPDSYRRVVDAEFRRLFTERSRSVAELQQVRCELADMADRYTAMVQSVEQDPALRTPAGQQPLFRTSLAKLSDAVATLQRDKARVLADWPVGDAAELAQAAIEHEQGRCIPVDEAFAQMRGISVEELHRRLETHKAKRKEYGWE
jgi:PAS domain-containing protein